uniref:Pco075678 n=1 Tax=Arundo donax TaxID=35708 RepID=A0A0A9R567_ARUDO
MNWKSNRCAHPNGAKLILTNDLRTAENSYQVQNVFTAAPGCGGIQLTESHGFNNHLHLRCLFKEKKGGHPLFTLQPILCSV